MKQEIARTIRAFTGGSFKIEDLDGPAMRFARMDLMRRLTGSDTDYDLGSLYAALYELYGVEGETMPDMRNKLAIALCGCLVT